MKVDVAISGFKCDNPSCDYHDSSIKFEEYEQYVNCPCPKCGQSLLTPQAYKMCLAMKNMGDLITKLTFGPKKNSIEYRMPVDMDADGRVQPKR